MWQKRFQNFSVAENVGYYSTSAWTRGEVHTYLCTSFRTMRRKFKIGSLVRNDVC